MPTTKSAPLRKPVIMITEIIPQKLTYSQSPELKQGTVQKLPLTGFIKIDLKEGWVEFIKRYEPYTWYVTLTFAEPKHPEAAHKAFKRWIRHINESLYNRRYREREKGVTYFKCMEYQKRDVIHFHCLIGDPNLYKLKRLDFMKAWECGCYGTNELVNGYARIDKYNASRGAVNYCSKYVLKGGEIDVYISPEQWHLLNDKEPMLQFIN